MRAGDLIDGVDLRAQSPCAASLAKALISTGIFEPLGFSNSSAGPPFFTLRSANSVISRCGIDFKRDALQFAVLFQGAE